MLDDKEDRAILYKSHYSDLNDEFFVDQYEKLVTMLVKG